MAKLPNHLFVSDCDGALYDTRMAGWSKLSPLRTNYRRSHQDLRNVADLKATLRNGRYAWPGGYPLYFICSDGGALNFDSVTENLREVISAIQDHDNSGWRVVACDVNYEDNDLYCDHSGEKIESAYGGDGSEE